MTTASFIDVASWQHPNGQAIDWQQVWDSGVRGVIIKATQGTWYSSPYFATDYEGAKAVGMAVGAYHFCEIGADQPEAEAAWFLSQTSGIDLELGRWADVEQPFNIIGQELASWVQTFLNSATAPGVPCGLYTDRDGLASLIGAPWNARLWLALGGAPPDPRALIGQTGTGNVPGIGSSCDLDTCYNVRAFNLPGNAGGAQPAPPAPAPPAPPTTEVYPMNELQIGSTGTQVEVLQWLLNEKSNTGLAVDGNFGPITQAAVTAFQGGNGLATDGVVGPLTWAALLA